MSLLKNFVLGTAATTALATAASADFIGFDGDLSQIGDYTVIQMNAVFTNDSDVLLNLFEMDALHSDGQIDFNQSDVQIGAGGTWAPNASLDIPGFADSAIDSYVTIGYGVGTQAPTNGTALDPAFLDATGGLGPSIPVGAGWYNGNPTNQQTGSAYAGGYYGLSGFAVSVGQFVFETESWSNFAFILDGQVGYTENGEVQFGDDTFIVFPTPGALALLGLGGLTTRRRKH